MIDPVITCKKVKDDTLHGLLDHYAVYLQILKKRARGRLQTV
jgi:hypothetical protein